MCHTETMNPGYFSSAAYFLLYVRTTQLEPALLLEGTGYSSLEEVEALMKQGQKK